MAGYLSKDDLLWPWFCDGGSRHHIWNYLLYQRQSGRFFTDGFGDRYHLSFFWRFYFAQSDLFVNGASVCNGDYFTFGRSGQDSELDQYAPSEIRKMVPGAICAVVIIIMGIVLLCNPFQEEQYMILYIGICLILDGLTNLTSLICIQMRVRKLARIQKEHPEVQLKDLLEQKGKHDGQNTEIIIPEGKKDTGKQE